MIANTHSSFTMHNLSFWSRFGITSGLAVNFLIVLTYKLLVLKWTMKIGTRISILILIDEFEKFLAMTIVTYIYISQIVYDTGLEEIVSQGWLQCAVRFLGFSCFLALFYSGLAISVMRLIYIKGRVFLAVNFSKFSFFCALL